MMVRNVLLVLALGFAANAYADMYRVNGKVIADGDSATRVLDNLGEPARKEPVTNRYGAPVGELWYYRDRDKTVRFFVAGGKVISIEQIR